MANIVNFYKGTATKYAELANKDINTFYYVDEKDLYLGSTKISNAADLAAAVERIATNEGDISKLKEDLAALIGSDTGSIADMIKALEDKLQPEIDSNKDAIDAINDADTGILAKAKTYADGKDEAIADAKKAGTDAQADIDALEEKVGTVTEGKTVVEMISDAQKAATYDDTQVKADIKTNKDAIDVLNGTGDGSVSKQVADAVANIVADAPEAYDTLKEISDWISSHASDASDMNSRINTNKEDIAKLVALVGTLPEGSDVDTIVAYIDEKVAGVDFSSEIATAKSEAIDEAKKYADGLAGNYATAEQGKKADSAVQSVVEGSTNGTISVDGTEVNVHGLGSAAYTESSAYDVAGSANTVKTAVIGTSTDAKTADTINGAKAYADDAVATALEWKTLE